MPVICDTDKYGNYFSWGKTGKRYYFNDLNEISVAYHKALKQGRAIHARKH